MEKYLKSEIKSIIEGFPEVGAILEKFGIGCVPCTVATCKLEEVVKIHALSPETYAEMMYFIEKVIYPDREVIKPKIVPSTEKPVSLTIRYSPPVKRLVDEHLWIKRVLALIPAMTQAMSTLGKVDVDLVSGTVAFIKGYADTFHHMKEEDILFDYTDKTAEIIKVIFQDHDRGRGFVKAVVEGAESGDLNVVCQNLEQYRRLLQEHIKKEDEVLYPFIDRGLTDRQVGELFSRFNEVESKTASDVPQKFLDFVLALENRFKQA